MKGSGRGKRKDEGKERNGKGERGVRMRGMRRGKHTKSLNDYSGSSGERFMSLEN